MKFRPLPADEAAVRRFIDELWLPYHMDLEATVDRHALADDVDVASEELAFRLERLESESYRAWVAVDDEAGSPGGGDADHLAELDGEFAGFVTTDVEESPSVFDQPDRLVVGDIYVAESYRGTSLARDLVDRAERRARETGCAEVVLDVDVDNDRAIAFYEKLGFEPYRYRMAVPVDEL